MTLSYSILSKTHRKLLGKTASFLLILVLVWQFSFPRTTSFAFYSQDLMFVLDENTQEVVEIKVLTQEKKMIQIITEVASQENFDNPELLLAIAKAESRFNPNIRGEQDSRDRGLYQINSYYNPNVTDECAFDPWCSTEWTISELEAGHAWKWNASRYKWGRSIIRN